MPNHITTVISTRNKNDLLKVINKLCGTNQTSETLKLTDTSNTNIMNIMNEPTILNIDEHVDFNNITPMPEALNNGSSPLSDICTLAIVCYLKSLPKNQLDDKLKPLYEVPQSNVDMFTDSENSYGEIVQVKVMLANIDDNEYNTMRNKVLPYVPKDGTTLEQYGEMYYNNISKYKYFDWYSWSIANWGTKWNAYNDAITDKYVSFDTAWSMPEPIITKLSQELPNIELFVLYADEDIGSNYGAFAIKNGVITEEINIENGIEFGAAIKGYDPSDFYDDEEEV